jgi:hypothetical protein
MADKQPISVEGLPKMVVAIKNDMRETSGFKRYAAAAYHLVQLKGREEWVFQAGPYLSLGYKSAAEALEVARGSQYIKDSGAPIVPWVRHGQRLTTKLVLHLLGLPNVAEVFGGSFVEGDEANTIINLNEDNGGDWDHIK